MVGGLLAPAATTPTRRVRKKVPLFLVLVVVPSQTAQPTCSLHFALLSSGCGVVLRRSVDVQVGFSELVWFRLARAHGYP